MTTKKNFKLTSFELINLLLSIIILILSFISTNYDLSYGGKPLLIASIISIILIKICPINFNKFEINIIQFQIFLSIFLGTTLNFYSIIPEFDFYIHLFSGLMCSILSMPIIRYFCNKSNLKISNLKVGFIIFIIFGFSASCGMLWEIYEFSVDRLLLLSTQNNSLIDTMTDIIANTIGSIVFCIIYLFKHKEQAK